MRKIPFLIVFVFQVLGCASFHDDPSAHGKVIIYTAFISGGDAPLVDSLAVFEDGFARYHLVGRSPRWIKLTINELREAHIRRAELGPMVPSQAHRRCCDNAELFVDLEKSPNSFSAIEPKQIIVYPSRSSDAEPPAIRRLIAWRNHAVRRIGGRNSLRVPTNTGA